MNFPVTLKSKNQFVSDETWTNMVAGQLAELSQEELAAAGNPITMAEARLQDSLELLFQQPPPKLDPYQYVDREYGKPDEDITHDEVLTIRSMANEGMQDAMICDILGLSQRLVNGVITGKFYPCVGGTLRPVSKTGLKIPAWHSNLERMTVAVLAEAMSLLPPDLFELLCNQNGLDMLRVFDAVNIMEERNDEEDRQFYRSFLRRLLREKTPGEFEAVEGNRRRRPIR